MATSLFEVKEELVFNKELLNMINGSKARGRISKKGNIQLYEYVSKVNTRDVLLYIVDSKSKTRCVCYDNIDYYEYANDFLLLSTTDKKLTIIDSKTLDITKTYTSVCDQAQVNKDLAYIATEEDVIILDKETCNEIHREKITKPKPCFNGSIVEMYTLDKGGYTFFEHLNSDIRLLVNRRTKQCVKVFHNDNIEGKTGNGVCDIVIIDTDTKTVKYVTVGDCIYTPDEFFKHFNITINKIDYAKQNDGDTSDNNIESTKLINRYIGQTADGRPFEIDGYFNNMRIDNKVIRKKGVYICTS